MLSEIKMEKITFKKNKLMDTISSLDHLTVTDLNRLLNDLCIPRYKGAEKINSLFSCSGKSREWIAARYVIYSLMECISY